MLNASAGIHKQFGSMKELKKLMNSFIGLDKNFKSNA